MSIFKKLFGQKDDAGETPECKALLDGSMEGLSLQNQAHQDTWGLGKAERWDLAQVAVMNLLANTVPFVPIGFLVPLAYRKMTWQKSLALAVAVGLAMEGMEGLFRVGIVDVDDVILNAFGVMIGYGVFTIFRSPKGEIAPSATTTTTR